METMKSKGYRFGISGLIGILFLVCFPRVSFCERLREPAFAGSWYPAEPLELRAAVRSYTAGEEEPPQGEVRGLVCPHAAYPYSGRVAGHAYRVVRGCKYDVVLLVGPSHRYGFRGISVYSSGTWNTPLGPLKIDEAVAQSILATGSPVKDIEEAHANEHSLELQLPFIRETLGDVPIVPIVMGDQDFATARVLASAIATAVKGKKCLLIASSDLSHYHPGDVANRMDGLFAERLEALDVPGIAAGLRRGQFEACGGGPVMAVLLASRELGAGQVEILERTHSGHVTGDESSVVGYLAAAILAGPPGLGTTGCTDAEAIGRADQLTLHEISRETIAAGLDKRAPAVRTASSPALAAPRAVFVTLTIGGSLRGCMGQMVPRASLSDAVKEMALAAAFSDPRFPPLTREEFEKVKITISVLSSLRSIDDPQEVAPGTHGVYLRQGRRSGVLLPQVAVEQGWNRQQFLDATCRKAGLPAGCWQEDLTEIYVFTAQVF